MNKGLRDECSWGKLCTNVAVSLVKKWKNNSEREMMQLCYRDFIATGINEWMSERMNTFYPGKKCVLLLHMSLLTLWSHDKLVRSILRVLEGDEGEETHLSGTSGTKTQQHFIRVSGNRKRGKCRPLAARIKNAAEREKACWLVLH